MLGEIISGALGALGNIFGAEKSSNTAEANNRRQIEWERERAKNAHQWEISDLEKAGLNPILSAGGSGAVTGGINPQLPDTSGYGKAGETAGNAIMRAIEFKQRQQEINSSTALNQAKAAEAEANAKTMNKKMDEIDAVIANLAAQSNLYGKQSTTAEAQSRHYNQIIEESKIHAKKIQQEIDNLKVERDILKEEKKDIPIKRAGKKIQNRINYIESELKRKQNKLYYVDKGFEYTQKALGIAGTAYIGFGGAQKAITQGLNSIKHLGIGKTIKEIEKLEKKKALLYNHYGQLIKH